MRWTIIGIGMLVVAAAHATPRAPAPASPVIVIDPGHGGTNQGAYGPDLRLYEKRLTLKLALALRQRLLRDLPTARIVLTRRTDRYLTLAARVRLANRTGAVCFVSLHLNASTTRSQQGFEVYYLSQLASDQEAARLARRENTGALQAPRPTNTNDDVASILTDLRQHAAHAGSLTLARQLQHELRRARPQARDGGVRQAPFDVLLGLTMPAVLVEAGYIDHPTEGPELGQPATQAAIVEALSRGIATFLSP